MRTAEHAYLLDDSLVDLEQRLGDAVLRVHRNALVARRTIRDLVLRPSDDSSGNGWAVRAAPLDEWLAVRAALSGSVG